MPVGAAGTTSISYRRREANTYLSARQVKVKFHSLLELWRKLLITVNIPFHVHLSGNTSAARTESALAWKVSLLYFLAFPVSTHSPLAFVPSLFPGAMCSAMGLQKINRINICHARNETLCKECHFDVEFLLVNFFCAFWLFHREKLLGIWSWNWVYMD